MKITATPLPGVLLVEPSVFGDERGFFLESYRADRLAEAGVTLPFVQDNHSRSRKGVLRGLHFQIKHPQGKLVRVTQGEVFDVAVDIRPGSPSFGKWYGAHLSAENHLELWVPPGFAHGFAVLTETADFLYKCTGYYRPDDEGGILWNDPDIGINWPLADPQLSAKDRAYPRLKDIPKDRLPRG